MTFINTKEGRSIFDSYLIIFHLLRLTKIYHASIVLLAECVEVPTVLTPFFGKCIIADRGILGVESHKKLLQSKPGTQYAVTFQQFSSNGKLHVCPEF